MKCKLIFYCALVFHLELVASLPYALNVPMYVQNDAIPSTQDYIAPRQYWNQRPYNEENYKYPETQYQNVKLNNPQNYLNNQQYVPDSQYYGRYPTANQNLYKDGWAPENQWQNSYHRNQGQSVYDVPDQTLTVTDKQYFNDRGIETLPTIKKIRESQLLRENIVPKHVFEEKKEPLTVSKLGLFDPPIPAIPTNPVRYIEENNYIVKNTFLPVNLPEEVVEKQKIQTKMSSATDHRYFATSTNPIETIVTPAPVPIKTQIQQIMSNTKIKDMMTSKKSTSRYLVVYPNGTISRVNTLKSVAKQHPDYVLVHASELVGNPVQRKVEVSSNRPQVINESNNVIKPSDVSPPSNAPNKYNIPVQTTETPFLPNSSPLRTNIEQISNKTLGSFPLKVNLSPNITSSLIEIPAKSVVQLILPENTLKPPVNNEPVTVEPPPKVEDSIKLRESVAKTKEPELKQTEEISVPIATSITSNIPIKDSSESILIPVETLTVTTNESAVQVDIQSQNTTKSESPGNATLLVADADIQKEIPLKSTSENISQPTTPLITPADGIPETLPTNLEPVTLLSAIEITPNFTPPVELIPSTIVEKVIVNQSPSNDVSTNSTISNDNKLELPNEIIAQQSLPTTNEPSSAGNSTIIVTATNEEPLSKTIETSTTVAPVTDSTKEQHDTSTTISEISATTPVANKTSDITTASPSILKPILLNVAEGSTIPYLPGSLDISKVKTDENPMVWIKTTEDTFWNKLANGANDFDIVYFFNIKSPPRIENNISKTVYPNGTIVEEITKTVWDPDTDKSTVTKTTRVIPPDS